VFSGLTFSLPPLGRDSFSRQRLFKVSSTFRGDQVGCCDFSFGYCAAENALNAALEFMFARRPSRPTCMQHGKRQQKSDRSDPAHASKTTHTKRTLPQNSRRPPQRPHACVSTFTDFECRPNRCPQAELVQRYWNGWKILKLWQVVTLRSGNLGESCSDQNRTA